MELSPPKAYRMSLTAQQIEEILLSFYDLIPSTAIRSTLNDASNTTIPSTLAVKSEIDSINATLAELGDLAGLGSIDLGSDYVNGITPITKGGTGANNVEGAQSNLGIVTSEEIQQMIDSSIPEIQTVDLGSAQVTGTTPIVKGGTGANNASGARANLGVMSENASMVLHFEALRRSYTEAGYNLVDGSFEEGGTLTAPTDVLLHKSTGKVYAWTGALPKVVAPDTDPTAPGSGYVPRTDVVLRSEINIITRKLNSVAEMIADTTLVIGQVVETVSYLAGWEAVAKPRGGNTYLIVAAGTGTADGGSFIDLTGTGLQAYALFPDGIVRLTQFGANGDAITDNTSVIYNAIHYCLTNIRNMYIENGYYKFTTLEFNAANYPSTPGSLGEKGIEFYGEHRVGVRLDGEITFSAATPYSSYGQRFSGLQFRNMTIANSATDGKDGLVLSGFGRISAYNILTIAASGAGLALLGGSEFAAYGCQLQGSRTNLKIRPQTKLGEIVDASVIDFWNCDIANAQAGGKTVDIVGYDGRFISFHGGNLITSTAAAYFQGGWINLDCVNTENSNSPMYFDTCTILAQGCEFALGSPKFSLTNSHFQDMGNLWSANETKNIVLEDSSSTITLGYGRSYPTMFINHTAVTVGQIKFNSGVERFINDDISRQHYYPFAASAFMNADTAAYKTSTASLAPSVAGSSIGLPLKNPTTNLGQISAIEYIATSEKLELIINSVAYAASKYGLVFRLQDFGDGFKRYIFIPRIPVDVSGIRYVFAATTDRFDSVRVYGTNIMRDKIRAAAVPTFGAWLVGDEIEISTPAAAGYRNYVCTVAGSPGTWKGWGVIAS